MKSIILLSLLFIVFNCNGATAQVTAFTGKLVDEHNQPVGGAHIKVYKSGKSVDLQTDYDGFFHLAQIQAGDYWADINANGRIIRSKKLLIQPEGRVKLCYNFKLYAHGVTVSIMAQNRDMATRFAN